MVRCPRACCPGLHWCMAQTTNKPPHFHIRMRAPPAFTGFMTVIVLVALNMSGNGHWRRDKAAWPTTSYYFSSVRRTTEKIGIRNSSWITGSIVFVVGIGRNDAHVMWSWKHHSIMLQGSTKGIYWIKDITGRHFVQVDIDELMRTLV